MTSIQQANQIMTATMPSLSGPRQATAHKTTASTYTKNSGDKVTLQGDTHKEVSMTTDRVTTSYSLLKQLVVRLLHDQGVNTILAAGGKTDDIQNLTPGEARDLISENGYLGVKQTSDRIVQFAIASAGNDPEKLAAIKAGVEKGFAMAEEAFGGALPEISHKTYDAVMEKLDAWAKDSGQEAQQAA